eukprot:6210243-Pleurochrysis_carterae.AAC.1
MVAMGVHRRAQSAHSSAHCTIASERTSEKFSPPTTPLVGVCSWCKGAGLDWMGRAGGDAEPVPGLWVNIRPSHLIVPRPHVVRVLGGAEDTRNAKAKDW